MSMGTLAAAAIGAGGALLLVWLTFLIVRRKSATDHAAWSQGRPTAFAAHAAGAAGLGLTVIGTGLGVAFSAFSDPPGRRVPTAADIAQANADFNAVDARCNALMRELDDQRTRRLVAIPEAKVAVDRLETALRAAQTARLQAERTATDARAAAEARADMNQRDAQDKFDGALRDFDADRERVGIVEKARADHESRLREIDSSHSTLAERDTARTASAQKYQHEVALADQKLKELREKANTDYRTGYAGAQQQAIADIQKARRDEQQARENAEKAFIAARQAAQDSFVASMAALPKAAAVEADIRERQNAANAQCAQEREAIVARLRS